MTLTTAISSLLDYAERTELIGKQDRCFCANRLMEIFSIDDLPPSDLYYTGELHPILDFLTDAAYEMGIISENSSTYRDLFDTRIMGILTPMPSTVTDKFYSLYKENPEKATDWFYSLAINSNYIRKNRIKNDIKWQVDSEYGKIDITINLSKPEKDPKAIAAAKLLPQSGYPKCLLCVENVGYAGNLSKPARQNLRMIPFDMASERWYLQYSPYVYYNEHCIALAGEHTPMQINKESFVKLLGFVTEFPHYFIGSNADLPIVGGSILSHDHMQGGKYSFAMEKATIKRKISFKGFSDVDAGILKWPMSVIRLISDDKKRLVSLAELILDAWRQYTDEEALIFANTNDTPHNTITPIARRRGKKYELDLVLRNNITTEEHPLGLYHPHSEHHNIKKENIGLIEVMGLAVLPSRLKNEMALLKDAILNNKDIDLIPEIKKHAKWTNNFKDSYVFTEENTEEILKEEIGKTFVRVLRDSGVFKDTEDGERAFLKFLDSVIQ